VQERKIRSKQTCWSPSI